MYKIGVDLGGTNIVSAVVDENNKIVARASEKTNAPRPAEEIFDDIAKTIRNAVANAGAAPTERTRSLAKLITERPTAITKVT